MTARIFLFFSIFFVSETYSLDINNNADSKSKESLKSEIKDYINHHLKDSHDFNLFSFTNEKYEHIYIGIPLPVLLWDNGIKIFSSSKLKHGEGVANIDGDFYKLYHDKIYKTNYNGDIYLDEFDHPTNIHPIDFSLTKGVVSIIITCLIMFFIFNSLAKSYRKNDLIAGGVGRFFEPIILYVRDLSLIHI